MKTESKKMTGARGVDVSYSPYGETWRSTLVAWLVLSGWIVVLSLPMWSGLFLGGAASDQLHTGHAWREWAAHQWRDGSAPLWNPWIFGGLPFVAASSGDTFYPTALLRIFLPTTFAMSLGFVLHYVLAGGFTYHLAKKFGTGWFGSVIAGLAYQLSGLVLSYVNPGHDGKLFVTALLPLAFTALIAGIRERSNRGFALFAATVGLALLSPQYQMAYYFLVATGIFTLYLILGEGEPQLGIAGRNLGKALGAVVLGFGIAMIQLYPFLNYIPYSPRAEGVVRGFEWATSYSIPLVHIPEFFLSGFAGDGVPGVRNTYWGPNGIKFHSEYVGLATLALAFLGAMDRTRRRAIVWLASMGLFFLLIALGSSTPFYRLFYELMPYVSKTRAPGMAFFVTILTMALFAGFGADRLFRTEGRKVAIPWIVVGLTVVAFGLSGGVAHLAEALSTRGASAQVGAGAVVSGFALAAIGVVVLAWQQSWINAKAGVWLVIGILGGDLYSSGRHFWVFTDIEREFYATDPIVERLQSDSSEFRVLNLSDSSLELYRKTYLMHHRIRQLLGHHGNELQSFDKLMGGQLSWSNVVNPTITDLYAVKYAVFPTGAVEHLPGYTRVLSNVTIASGRRGDLYQRDSVPPFARVVPGALKVRTSELVASVTRPGFPVNNVVLLDQAETLDVAALQELPPALNVGATVSNWAEGEMAVVLDWAGASDTAGFLVISENFFPGWVAASGDGGSLPVVSGDGSLITMPVDHTVDKVRLSFSPKEFRTGAILTVLSLLVTLAVGLMSRRGNVSVVLPGSKTS